MRCIGLILAASLSSGFVPAAAQDAPVGDAERRAVVLRAAELLEQRFYDARRAAKAGAHLRRRLEEGAYDELYAPGRFAAALTAEMRPLLNDQHFSVSYTGPVTSAPQAANGDADAAWRDAYRVRNYDFRELSVQEGNVGYLRLFTFAPARLGADTAAAAMRFLANTDAVIIDLRGNQGGYPDMGLLIASHFFAAPTHYATRYRRQGNRTEEQWTLAETPGPRLLRQDLFILISSDSFSGGESLAYSLQALRRATIVGERTRGGAAGSDTLRAGDRFEVTVSDVNYTSPATGRNWEGVGVRPDIAASRQEALTVAHVAALARLAERAETPARRAELAWAQDVVRARARPVPVRAARLLAGRYGERSVTWKSGRLLYRRGENPIFELRAVAPDTFMIDGLPTARFRFSRDRAGRGVSLIAVFVDGSEETSARTR